MTLLSFQVGWRKRPTIDLSHHVARVFPAPSPGQPSPVPPFCTLGGGAFSPHGPPLSSWPSLLLPHTSVTSHFPSLLPLAGFSPPTAPASLLPPFSVSLSLSPLQPRPSFPPWALFYSPGPRLLADAISGSNSEQLSNISVGREKACACCACQRSRGWMGALCQSPVPGDSHEPSLASSSATRSWVVQSHAFWILRS